MFMTRKQRIKARRLQQKRFRRVLLSIMATLKPYQRDIISDVFGLS